MTSDGRAALDKDGEPVTEHVEMNFTTFKPVSTFDVSQTEGEPLPQLGRARAYRKSRILCCYVRSN